ncbi:MAG: RNA-binding protein [Alphaproteobacteria bacterium]|nr:RNA-binding protein [Rhodospirillales bacterium]MCW9046126.1 RNA-binding protein [Alphaproteobacteria bacterium]
MKDEQPQRKCLVTGEVLPKENLIRFVVGPNQEVVPDIEGKLPGRGLWLSATRDVVNTACGKNAFAKGAKKKVVVPVDLADTIEALLVGRCLDLIGLGRRSGKVVAGYEKVRACLKDQSINHNKVSILFAASDGAEDGRRKIKALAPTVPLVELFRSDELAAAIGRDNTVHLVLSSRGLAEKVLGHCEKLVGFRAMLQNQDDNEEAQD